MLVDSEHKTGLSVNSPIGELTPNSTNLINTSYCQRIHMKASNKIQIIKSQREKEKLIYKNYTYNFDRLVVESKRFRCLNRKCRGFIIIDKDITTEEEIHEHPPTKLCVNKFF
ncbi:hypothetical protein CDIK_3135 [Cucumispora dikerogammari]|nr:hypothetical protein CDIK_3135 [Cucumispora dikerogammari]